MNRMRNMAVFVFVFGVACAAWAVEPVVSNVIAYQRAGTKLVDIAYNVTDPDSSSLTVSVQVSTNSGVTYDLPASSFSGSGYGSSVTPGTGKQIVWNAGADWNGQYSDKVWFKVTAHDGSDLGNYGNYVVIDISGGSAASNYPVSSLTAVPSGGWTDEHKTTKIVLRRILAGTFTMGASSNELGRVNEEIQHQVILTKDFYIGVFEVTQKQWELVMGNWPSYFNNASYRDTRPVEQVSYYEIRENPNNSAMKPHWPAWDLVHVNSFMGKLRAKAGLTTLDLPTESQWEYACRAGTTTALNSGKNLTAVIICPNMSEVGRYWYNGGSGYTQNGDTSVGTAKVGSYLVNQWGLYDMHGNAEEWCLDWHEPYPGTVTDPAGAASGSYRVVRSGGWHNDAVNCRSAYRGESSPSDRYDSGGLRVARTLAFGSHSAVYGPVKVDTRYKMVVNDYDGNGISELAVYDNNTGSWYAYSLQSGKATVWQMPWGWPGAETVSGDYDGDAFTDLAVYDQADWNWYAWSVKRNKALVWKWPWGWTGAETVPGDYDGDAFADLAVYDQADGNWYVWSLAKNKTIVWKDAWGWPGAITVPGDYDGDRINDLCVYDSITGYWYARNVAGTVLAWKQPWGWPGATSVPGDYDGDWKDDLAVYDQPSGNWYVWSLAKGQAIVWQKTWGWTGAVPVPGDYDGDGNADLAVFDKIQGYWYIWSVAKNTSLAWQQAWGWPGAYPPGGRE